MRQFLVAGFAEVGHGRLAEAASSFRQAFADCDPAGDVDLLSNLGLAAMHLGDDPVVLDRYGRLVVQSRQSGSLVMVLYALTRRATSEISTGDWAAAAAGAAEALDLARGTGQAALASLPLAWLTLLAALLRTFFERSQPVVFAWLDGRLIGMARVLSDGVCNASLLDVWTQSTIRKRGVAREMVNHLAAALPGQHLGLKTDDAEQFHTALGFWPQPQFMSLVVGGWLDNQANRR